MRFMGRVKLNHRRVTVVICLEGANADRYDKHKDEWTLQSDSVSPEDKIRSAGAPN